MPVTESLTRTEVQRLENQECRVGGLSANGERLLTPTQPARCRVVSEVPPEIDGPLVGAVYNAAGCVFRQGVGLASFDVVGSLELNCAETSEYKPRLVAGLAVKAC
jgi:hypothetical protein